MKQELEKDVCYEQEIASDELVASILSDNEGDWRPPASSECKMLTFQCSDCSKSFEKKASLTAHYKIHRKTYDKKLAYKDKQVDTCNKVHKTATPGTDNNKEDNEPRVSIKEEYDITPQIFKETGDESENNCSSSKDNGGEAEKGFKSPKDIHLTTTDFAEIKKRPKSSQRKKRDFPCEVCGRVFGSLFNLKRHSSLHTGNGLNIDLSSNDMDKIENPTSSNRKKREFPCKVCGRVFGSLFNLKRHSSLHPAHSLNTELIGNDLGDIENNSGNENKNVTLETENNIKNIAEVCPKEELVITPQILEAPMDELKQSCELLSSDSKNSDDIPSKVMLVKPVESITHDGTGIVKLKKVNRKRHHYPCEICGKVFNRLFNLKRHRAAHSDNDFNIDFNDMGEIEKPKSKSKGLSIACKVCGKMFAESCDLKRHSSVHSLTRPHECEICKYRFSTVNTLKCHLSQHKNGTLDHWKTNSRPGGFKCPDCPRRFEKIASLAGHRRKHTHINGNYPCMVCQRHFTTVRFLTKHIINKHPEEKLYKCDQCEKTFVSHALLVEHLNRHKGNKNLVCLMCEEEFDSTTSLTEHMRTHTGYTNSLSDNKLLHLCPQCGKTFSRDCLLRWHMERHSDVQKYQCPECPKRFTCKAYLKKHALRHSKAKPHACDICGSRFKTVNDVRHHKRWHSSEKPFKCDQCNMTFIIASVLKRHMRTHTGEKPYKCKYCGRAFADNADLNKHLRTHVGENTYMCEECPMTFKYYAELKEHQSEHYKTAKKQTQQISDEAQDHEINDNQNMQSIAKDLQQQLPMLDS